MGLKETNIGQHLSEQNHSEYKFSDLPSSVNYDDFNQIFTSTLNQDAPIKKKWIRCNHKPHMNKTLRKAIMLRSKLKNRANKSNDARDIKMYKQQRDLVVRLNKDSKYSYFSNLDIRKESKTILECMHTLFYEQT